MRRRKQFKYYHDAELGGNVSPIDSYTGNRVTRGLVAPIKVQQKVAYIIDVVLCHPMVTAKQKPIRHNLQWYNTRR